MASDPTGPTSTRRGLLGAGVAGVAGGAALLTGCDGDGGAATSGDASAPTRTGSSSSAADPFAEPLAVPDFDPADWDSVRAQFPLDPARGQFSAWTLSPHLAQVEAAVQYYRRRMAFDTRLALADELPVEAEVRQRAARFAGGGAGQFALTGSTTAGLALVYGGLRLAPGDEVVTTTHDFFATERCLELLAARTGARVRRVALYDDAAAATVGTMVDRLLGAVTDRTRVLAITWVHSSTGVRLPLAEIGRRVAALNADRDESYRVLVCVDGVHGFAAVDADLDRLGIDLLATGTHKWLFGPRGTGLVWARDWSVLDETVPSFTGTRGADRLTPGGFHAFEHRWAVREAFDVHLRIGRRRVVARTTEQAGRLKRGLGGVDGVEVVTPSSPEVSAGIVCFRVRKRRGGYAYPVEVDDALAELDVVGSSTPYQPSFNRLGPSIATTPEQVDAAVEAVAEVAARF